MSTLGRCGPFCARPPMDLVSLDSQALALQIQAIEQSTARGYATGARDYVRFCLSHSLPIDPTPTALAHYIAYTSQFIASRLRYLSGAHFLSVLYPAFDANRAHPLVQAMIRGSRKIRADPVHRKLPLRPHHLAHFVRLAEALGSYNDLLFAVILSCGFYACHHIGELVQRNDWSLFDSQKVIKCASLTFSLRWAQYHLPYHKADPFFRGTVILLGSHDVACPVWLLSSFVIRHDAVHHGRSPLFLTEQGQHPTRQWFDKRFFSSFNRSFGGHSLLGHGTGRATRTGLACGLPRVRVRVWDSVPQENPYPSGGLRVRFDVDSNSARNGINPFRWGFLCQLSLLQHSKTSCNAWFECFNHSRSTSTTTAHHTATDFVVKVSYSFIKQSISY